jgi:hypothetical protein
VAADLDAGGRPEPLSPDTVRLFSLQWHLSEVTELAVRLSRQHADDPDQARATRDLEDVLAALVSAWV